MSKDIAIDMDEVLANTSIEWLRYLESVTSVKLQNKPRSYRLTDYFRSELDYNGLDGFEFWKGSDPYKNVLPVEGAIEACTKLKAMGHILIPVTKVYTEHTNSKRKWLNKYFPMLEPAIYISMDGTKSRVKCDVIIDDRKENFVGFNSPTRGILLSSQYKQNFHGRIDIAYSVCDDWHQILEYFDEGLW